MYFTKSLSISSLANTMDLNYQFEQFSITPHMALTQQVRMGRKMATGTMSGETAMKNNGHYRRFRGFLLSFKNLKNYFVSRN